MGPSFFFSCSFILNPKGAVTMQSKIQSSKCSGKIKVEFKWLAHIIDVVELLAEVKGKRVYLF